MKIAQIVCAWPPYAGGIGNSAVQIGQALAQEHDLTNYYPANLRPWLKYGHSAFAPQLLAKLGRFDYIYLHYPFFGMSEIVWLFRLFNKRTKLIIHYHMDVDFDSPLLKIAAWPARLIRDSLFRKAQAIVCSSLDYVKNSSLKDFYQKYPEKFREIPFGVDTHFFQPGLLKSASQNHLVEQGKKIIRFVNERFINHHRSTILFVGGLDRAHYFKGVDNLIRAAGGLENKNWLLQIAGEGELQADYQRLAEALGLAAQVRFLGKLSGEELVKAFQRADVLVLPSINRNEAFGLVLIEAMACGTPVIASDLPGVRSVFTDGQEGLAIKPGDVQNLQDKLSLLLNNQELREKMGQAGRRLVELKYDKEQQAAKILSLFR